jgi:Adenylate and Guanylate cyclase catalytic domain
MESNGERNRIQVSQSTADLIGLAGKGRWLMARADKVHAKGKGEMQTYWCDPTISESNNPSRKSELVCSDVAKTTSHRSL